MFKWLGIAVLAGRLRCSPVVAEAVLVIIPAEWGEHQKAGTKPRITAQEACRATVPLEQMASCGLAVGTQGCRTLSASYGAFFVWFPSNGSRLLPALSFEGWLEA
jgi:hypothetical protein